MADQETANVAVLAIGVGSPASSAYPFTPPPCGRDCSDTEDELLITSQKDHGQYYTPARLKENVQNLINQPLKKSEKMEEPCYVAETDSVADDMADIFISDEVLRQLRSNDKDVEKTSLRLKKKSVKTQRKTVKSAAVNRRKELEINSKSATGKKTLKSAMRSKSSMPLEYDDDDPAEASDKEDKPKNNNWLASEDASVTHQTYIKNPSLSNLPFQSSDSICRICSMKNCSTHNVMGSRTTTDPLNEKEYSFKRADSSDDSGCFSNQSLQSINSPVTGGQDRCEEDSSSQHDGQVSILTADHKSFPATPCLCSACGNEPQGNGSGLCKTCIGRIKQEHARIGSIDWRAYANIIADSVKKILYINPKERKEVVHFTKERADLDRKKSVNMSSPNMFNTQSQKSKILSETTGTEEVHVKSLQNKSASFDERGEIRALEEVNRPSSVYWGSQEKLKVLSRSTTMSEIGEDKLRLVPGDVGDCASVDDDYFRAVDKDAANYQNLEDDRVKVDRLDRSVKKSYTKQMSCMDRVRNDGDARPISQVVTQDKKNLRDDNTKVYSIQRSKSRIIQRTNAVEPEAKCFKTKEEDMNALNVFRLKVINEGSPVDPLNTVQKGKVDDLKDRRALLMRSATAPNKNVMQKKDSNAERKDSNVGLKTKRVNTKTSMVAPKSPEPPKEERLANVQSKAVAVYESPSESFRDDSSVNPFPRRRSTSYDAKKTKPKKGERHRSISRPGTDREDKNKKPRRQTVASMDKSSGKKSSEGEKKFQTNAAQPQRYNYRSSDGSKTEGSTSVFPYQRREFVQENVRDDGTETIGLEVSTGAVDAQQASAFCHEDKIKPISSSSKESYYEGGDYYTSPANQSYSPRVEEPHLAVCRKTGDTYYSEPEKSQDDYMDKQVMEFDHDSNERRFNEVAGCDDEDDDEDEEDEEDDEDSGIEYHEDVQKYKGKEMRSEQDSLWYDSHAGRKALMYRDRSHESKSSTSFHVVTSTRSSHSDEALMRHSGSRELAPARRQSHMYSETDVDTGLMYHFAKRQTTRSHVPAYQDFTKDIYTMSGDVSTSSSSNSGISTKSEVNESAYTGGFFKRDPFYENETQMSSSSSSSETSSDQLYFESNNSTKREPSELDIYTGAIFSCSQNALSLGYVGEPNSGNPIDALKDGSTNNSTRPPVRHMSRRLRYRPNIDIIKFKSTDSISEFLSRSILPSTVDIALLNMSNNSSITGSWCITDGSGDNSEQFEQESVVKLSETPTYTDYDSVGMPRPISPVKKVKASPSFDLLKYDRPEYVGTSPSSYMTHPVQDSADPVDKWYDGYKKFQSPHSSSQYPSRPMSPLQCTFPWQQADDYYKSSQRPRVNKSNNCTFEQADQDYNNNRLEDMYTGFFDVPPSRPYPQDQTAPNVRRSPSENWYAENPRRGNSPTGFYGPTRSESPGRPYAADYESTEGAYSSSSVFGQASSVYGGASRSPPYMSPRAFQEYERSQTSSSGFYEDESPRVRIPSPPSRSPENMYGYFTYGSKPAMGDGGYMYEGISSYDPYVTPDSETTEIKKVGGIVIRENVANKEDYAEDVNRDLEQGTWVPFNYRLEEKIRHPEEASNTRPDLLSEAHKLVGPGPGPRSEKAVKCFDDGLYQQNHVYDLEPRKNWRDMPKKRQMSQDLSKKVDKPETPAPHKAHAGGDSKKEFKSTWNPPDQIPDRARGKRTIPKSTSVAGTDASKNNSSSNVVSSVVSLPSRLTNYVRKFF